jgi:hypothetical protein
MSACKNCTEHCATGPDNLCDFCRDAGSLFAPATCSVLVGVCNCGHFEPHYETHETCPDCAQPWHVMHWLQAMHYLHNIYEDEQKLKRYWKERCETLNH